MKIQNGCTIIQHGNRASKYNKGSKVKISRRLVKKKERKRRGGGCGMGGGGYSVQPASYVSFKRDIVITDN
jgi:hypothetical protein